MYGEGRATLLPNTTEAMTEALTIYNRATRNFSKEVEDDSIRKLNTYGVWSMSALASIVGVSMYRVEKALGRNAKPSLRGHLNPRHLTMLQYMQASTKANKAWVKQMLDEGTSLITIARLTGLSESTLRRSKR